MLCGAEVRRSRRAGQTLPGSRVGTHSCFGRLHGNPAALGTEQDWSAGVQKPCGSNGVLSNGRMRHGVYEGVRHTHWKSMGDGHLHLEVPCQLAGYPPAVQAVKVHMCSP